MCEHKLATQAKQSCQYDCVAQPQQFWLSDHILLLVSTANCKFLMQRQDPFMMAELVGQVHYHLQQLGKHKDIMLMI